MQIKELRNKTGMSQSKFAEKFHLNKGTLANWEQGFRNTPESIEYMIERILFLEEELEKYKKN